MPRAKNMWKTKGDHGCGKMRDFNKLCQKVTQKLEHKSKHQQYEYKNMKNDTKLLIIISKLGWLCVRVF